MKKSMQDHMILAVHVTNRLQQVGRVQEVLTQYGKFIKTRIGLHEANGRSAVPNGVIVLECLCSRARLASLKAELDAIAGIETQAVVFSH